MMELTYKPLAGQTLDSALAQALTIAAQNYDQKTQKYPTVHLRFNDVGLAVGLSAPADLLAEMERCKEFYHSECERLRREYEASPAGQAQKRARNKQVAEDRTTMSRLLKELAALPANAPLPTVVKWVGEMAKVNDDMSVSEIFSEWESDIVTKLKAMGYTNNAFTGPEYDANDSYKSGAYIIGQAINCLESGLPIHQIAVKFCHEWLTRWGYAEVKA